MPDGAVGEDLLKPIFRAGQLVYELPSLAQIQARCREQLKCLSPTIKRLENPHAYPAGLERGLAARKMDLINQHRMEGAK